MYTMVANEALLIAWPCNGVTSPQICNEVIWHWCTMFYLCTKCDLEWLGASLERWGAEVGYSHRNPEQCSLVAHFLNGILGQKTNASS